MAVIQLVVLMVMFGMNILNKDNFAFGHVTNTHITTDESTFQLTGCQLDIGNVATPFEFKNYEESLAKCQRYYWTGQMAHAINMQQLLFMLNKWLPSSRNESKSNYYNIWWNF